MDDYRLAAPELHPAGRGTELGPRSPDAARGSIVQGLWCAVCGREYPAANVAYACPVDGPLATLEVRIDYALVDWTLAGSGMWRYRPLLPVEPSSAVPALALGSTPLEPVRRLRAELGLSRLWIKDDSRLPTASLKDRASSLCIVKAREAGAAAVSCASTGNAAASWAAVAAAEGFPCHIFVPAGAPRAKMAQLLACGATVFAVDGTYDDAFDLCLAASDRFGWYNRNTGYNPYTVEGKKTVSFEIAEQLGWHAPDVVVVPVGDGVILSGVAKGFRDLIAIGAIDSMPRLVAAQAEGSAAISRAIELGGPVLPVEASTIADSISVNVPRAGAMALRAIRDSAGTAMAVPDTRFLAAQSLLARLTGIFAEPSSSTALAVAAEMAAAGRLSPDETVVVLITGSGLKDVEAALRGAASTSIPVRTIDDVARTTESVAWTSHP
ncbi:MAG: threonine synthase [Chloroflexota bacterium]